MASINIVNLHASIILLLKVSKQNKVRIKFNRGWYHLFNLTGLGEIRGGRGDILGVFLRPRFIILVVLRLFLVGLDTV